MKNQIFESDLNLVEECFYHGIVLYRDLFSGKYGCYVSVCGVDDVFYRCSTLSALKQFVLRHLNNSYVDKIHF